MPTHWWPSASTQGLSWQLGAEPDSNVSRLISSTMAPSRCSVHSTMAGLMTTSRTHLTAQWPSVTWLGWSLTTDRRMGPSSSGEMGWPSRS